ncbi:isoflavone 7-O-methyltransferase isoform X2 [Arachis hypogaea]|uniref:isoflavone 7-O-methyltransferase isoform X2 n=1 Tax=Arachis hypogaea TaxID=3818 RepID=UPI003B20C13C
MASNNNGRTASESFKAQALVYRHMYGILDSMCLKWIVDFRIPNIIHNHGKPITLLELVSVLKIPSAKVDSTDLFMHYMAHNGFFDIVTIHGDDDSNQEEEEKEAFALTAASELLIKGTENPSISPVVEMFLDDPTLSSSIHHLNKWFYDENRPLYEITLGKPLWEFLDKNPANLSLFNDAMASDSQMIKLALKDHNMVFEGLETIVDVGGGNGTTALIISEKFPALKCIVFDLPMVVESLKGCNNLSFVGGDMFESIPKADAILLKMIKLALKDHNMVFEGLETIVDVGGGNGTTALIISEKFPALKCIVFDLPMVVESLKGFNNLSFVGGDMFDSIPKADAILLKMIKLALKDHNMVFEGLETIVDVGGGNGTTALIISEKFPALKCIVFDLPMVVESLKGFNNLSFVGGDMFDSIPKADAILLKLVLHNWSDDNCIKILKNCKDAVKVSSKSKKGKIIILETVINEEQDEPEITRLKYLMTLNMQIIHGRERTKEEWKNIFYEAGLYNYKIFPFTGYLSLIEVYP